MKQVEPVFLRFFFEWGGGCLWPENDRAYNELGFGPYDLDEPCRLPVSKKTLETCAELAAWHGTSLNWDYPPDPGPWRQSECDHFNIACARLFEDLQKELGPAFRLINTQEPLKEDPNLDAYLADPKGFRRQKN